MIENIVEDIIDVESAGQNLRELVDQVSNNHTQKVIISNNRPAALLVSVTDYQAMQDRLLAMELELGLKVMLEEHKRGELMTLEDLAAEFGVDLTDDENLQEPEGYQQMVPRRFRNAS